VRGRICAVMPAQPRRRTAAVDDVFLQLFQSVADTSWIADADVVLPARIYMRAASRASSVFIVERSARPLIQAVLKWRWNA
jgi:hypothetical protein